MAAQNAAPAHRIISRQPPPQGHVLCPRYCIADAARRLPCASLLISPLPRHIGFPQVEGNPPHFGRDFSPMPALLTLNASKRLTRTLLRLFNPSLHPSMTPSIARRVKSPTIPRIAIRSRAEGDEPRARLELNALCALGFVLGTREWWTQWTTNQHACDEWVQAMEDLLIQENVAQVLAVWPRVEHPSLRALFTPLIEAATAHNTATLDTFLGHVMYPVPTHVEADAFNEDASSGTDDGSEWRDSDQDDEDGDAEDSEHGGDDDSDDDTALDEDGNIVAFDVALAQARQTYGSTDGDERKQDEDAGMDAADMIQLVHEALEAHESKNPFGQIGWYVKIVMLGESLLSRDGAQDLKSVVEAAVEQALCHGSAAVIERTVALIQQVLRNPDPCSLPAIQAQLPSETRAAVLDALHVHFSAVAERLEMTINDIKAVLDIVIHHLGLPANPEDLAPPATFSYPGPVPMTWMSDTLVAPELKAKFVQEVAALESVSSNAKDWDAANQVLRLIDPSLFCGVVGETKRLPQSAMNKLYGNAAEQAHACNHVCTSQEQPRGCEQEEEWVRIPVAAL